jgi:hypothetical protein
MSYLRALCLHSCPHPFRVEMVQFCTPSRVTCQFRLLHSQTVACLPPGNIPASNQMHFDAFRCPSKAVLPVSAYTYHGTVSLGHAWPTQHPGTVSTAETMLDNSFRSGMVCQPLPTRQNKPQRSSSPQLRPLRLVQALEGISTANRGVSPRYHSGSVPASKLMQVDARFRPPLLYQTAMTENLRFREEPLPRSSSHLPCTYTNPQGMSTSKSMQYNTFHHANQHLKPVSAVRGDPTLLISKCTHMDASRHIYHPSSIPASRTSSRVAFDTRKDIPSSPTPQPPTRPSMVVTSTSMDSSSPASWSMHPASCVPDVSSATRGAGYMAKLPYIPETSFLSLRNAQKRQIPMTQEEIDKELDFTWDMHDVPAYSRPRLRRQVYQQLKAVAMDT